MTESAQWGLQSWMVVQPITEGQLWQMIDQKMEEVWERENGEYNDVPIRLAGGNVQQDVGYVYLEFLGLRYRLQRHKFVFTEALAIVYTLYQQK